MRHVIGNIANGVKSTPSLTKICTVVGDLSMKHNRMPYGEILSLADVAACRSSMQHLGKTLGRLGEGGHQNSVATVAVDAVSFRAPLYHGDYVVLESSVVHVGNSSVAVRIQSYRDFAEGTRQHVSTSVFHMVSIDPKLRPVKNVPGLELHSEEELRWSESVVARKQWITALNRDISEASLQKHNANSTGSTAPSSPSQIIPISATEVVLDRIFFPAHVNFNNTVFGGEIMNWMEKCALLCGRRFTQSDDVHTMAMHNLTFVQPIQTTDWVKARARVIFTRSTTFEVEVDVVIDHGDGRESVANTAWFLLGKYNGETVRVPLNKGVTPNDDETQVSYLRALKRYEWSRTNPDKMFR
eukprot:PhF_6_TR40017/c0_g1_i1/m.59387